MVLPFFHYLQIEIKNEMKLKISVNKFDENDLIQFSTEDLKDAKWISDEEILYDDRMYDLVKTKIVKDKKIYFFLSDNRETKVKKYKTKIASIFNINKNDNLIFRKSVVNYSLSQTNFIFVKTFDFLLKFYDRVLNLNFKTPKYYVPDWIFYTDIPPEIYC